MLSIYELIIYAGVYQLGWWVYRIVCLILRTLFGTKCTTERYGHDSWAVITGGTGVMGKAIAMHLASQGFNIVLISRTLDKLNNLALEIQNTTKKVGRPVKTRVLVFDLVKDSKPKDFEKLYQEKLRDIDISVLVHNASTGQQPAAFIDTSVDQIHQTMTVNTYPTVLLTQQIMQSFKRRYTESNLPSLVIHTSSMTGLIPTPFSAVFSSTKIFGDFMALGL